MRAAFNSTRIERYGLFLLVMMLFGLGGGLFRGVQDNYLAFLGIDEAGRGVVEFFRELPGLLLFLLLALLYKMAERYIIRLALGFSVAGMLGFLAIGTGIVPAVFCLTLWSLGEHLIMPVRQSCAERQGCRWPTGFRHRLYGGGLYDPSGTDRRLRHGAVPGQAAKKEALL
jgi:hypothetical protein